MAKGSGSSRMTAPGGGSKSSLSIQKSIENHVRMASNAVKRLMQIVADKAANGFSRDTDQFKFGTISKSLATIFEQETGIHIVNRDMYTGQSSLFHHRTGEKDELGKTVPLTQIAKMPQEIGKMDVFINRNGIVFTDYKVKYILQPNYEVRISRKQKIVTNHVSSSLVTDPNDFTLDKGYKKIIL